jgi:hypothetical protein
MEVFTQDKLLEREYPLNSSPAYVPWLAAQGQGTLLQTYDFPGVLFSQQFVAERLDGFRYFRGAFEISIRCVSQQFNYGEIMVVYIPNNDYLATHTAYGNVVWMSGFPHMLISAQQGDVVRFRIPMIIRNRCVDLLNYSVHELGSIYLVVLAPLIQTNESLTTASASLFVTGKFIDTEVMFPISHLLTSLFMRNNRLMQAELTLRRQRRLGRLITEERPIEDDYFIAHSEANNKSTKNSISSKFNQAATLASNLVNVPIAGDYFKAAAATGKTAAKVFSMIGLDKPTTLAATQITSNQPNWNDTTAKGISRVAKYAQDPENAISTKPNVGGISVDEMSFDYVCNTPQLVWTKTLTPTSVLEEISTLTFNEGVYCDHVANMFQHANMTFKFYLYFVASRFHSARFVVWINTSLTSTSWEDCYHQIIDVQGDTEVMFSIPYLHNGISSTISPTIPVYLWISTLTWDQPDSNLNCPITLLIYKAATNCQFGVLSEFFVVAPSMLTDAVANSNPREKFAESFQPFHPSMVGYEHDGLIWGEQYHTFRDIIHRPMFYYRSVTTARDVFETTALTGGTPTKSYFMGIEAVARFYMFWRGSMRIVCYANSGLSTNTLSALMITRNISGQNYPLPVLHVSNPTDLTTSCEVPYYYRELWQPTQVSNTNTFQFKINDTIHYVLKAGGDDMSMHFLCPFSVPGSVVEAGTIDPSNHGSVGVVGYYSLTA